MFIHQLIIKEVVSIIFLNNRSQIHSQKIMQTTYISRINRKSTFSKILCDNPKKANITEILVFLIIIN